MRANASVLLGSGNLQGRDLHTISDDEAALVVKAVEHRRARWGLDAAFFSHPSGRLELHSIRPDPPRPIIAKDFLNPATL